MIPASDLVRSEPLPRPLRHAVLAVIAICHLYLLAHSQEPLRLNVGDPWSDANVLTAIRYHKEYGFLETSFTDILDVGPLTEESYRYTHYPPLAEILYGAAHSYLGVDSIGTFRLFAIGFSALAMLCLFLYVRRLYGESIALVATMLWSCNLLWLMYADSIHQAPIMQASAFAALWGLLKALDEGRARHWALAWVGCFACFLTSYDYWVFLPVAVLVTVGVRRGNPLRPANLRPVLLCASGCAAAIVAKAVFVSGAVGWTEFVADLHFQFLERSTSTYELAAPVPTLWRRATMVFSPLVWPVLGVVIVRFARSRTWTTFVRDGVWLLATALVFFLVFRQLATAQMLPTQVALPFVTIGTAMLVVELLRRGGRLARRVAIAIVVIAPVWSFAWLAQHPRAFLGESDIAKVQAYLREHDRNDFLVTNLMADGPIQAYFDRHFWPAFSSYGPGQLPPAAIAHQVALDVLARSGRDHYHVLFFNDPDSRMIDKSLWTLAAPRSQWSVAGWPFFFREKSRGMIREYDRNIQKNLAAIGATVVVQTTDVTIYRVTRDDVVATAGARLPDRTFVDLGSFTSQLHRLSGWGTSRWVKERFIGGADVVGREECRDADVARCRTVLTKRGVVHRGQTYAETADVMVRVRPGCEVDVVVAVIDRLDLAIELNGRAALRTSTTPDQIVARFASDAVREDVNVVTLRGPTTTRPDAARTDELPTVSSVEVRRMCDRGPR